MRLQVWERGGEVALLLHQSLRPMVPLVLKSQRSLGFAAQPNTLGEHLKKRRLQQELTQAQVGKALDTDEWTVGNWEKDKTFPAVRYFPAIFRFLGYDPFPKATAVNTERASLYLAIEMARLLYKSEGARHSPL